MHYVSNNVSKLSLYLCNVLSLYSESTIINFVIGESACLLEAIRPKLSNLK